MNKKSDIISSLLEKKIVAIIRHHTDKNLVETMDAIAEGGISAIEVTANTPNFEKILKQLSIRKDVIPGSGTILDVTTAKKAIDSGAKYLVSPICPLPVAAYCRKHDIVFIPGTFTPTEIVSARELGGDIIKVFPSITLGPGFFKALRGPLKDIPVMATGGISTENANSFLQAGANMIGIGTNLFGSELIDLANFKGITNKVKSFNSGL